MMADVLAGLVRANLAAAASILLVLALRGPARRLFGARVAYGLWILAPAAVAAGLLPQPARDTLISPIVLDAAAAAGRAVPPALAGDQTAPLLMALWLMGAVVAAGLLVRRQQRFMASLGRLTPLSRRELRAEATDVGPAVVGAFRPRIVTPADFEARFAPDERAVILAHEEVHLATGDARINALAAAAQCAAWFNPLVHLAVRQLRIDQELACDAAVLTRFPTARRLYAELLLKAQLATQPVPFGCHWPADAEHPLKERIVMLKSPLPGRSRRIAGLAAVATLSLSGAAAAWAAQAPAAPTLITAPVWIAKPDGADIARVYPAAAKAQGLSGQALMTCRVDGEGRLTMCAIAKQVPDGGGFGDAVLQLADRFQMEPKTKDGVATRGGEVRIPVRFMP